MLLKKIRRENLIHAKENSVSEKQPWREENCKIKPQVEVEDRDNYVESEI